MKSKSHFIPDTMICHFMIPLGWYMFISIVPTGKTSIHNIVSAEIFIVDIFSVP